MAIKMVREPSETPNINNIDDIVPMRYAYGNQNGYVIGKGTEISNTVNGLNFTVNSGRLVLQGVECDIDAVGVTITIDNIATKRYYVVYLQVNLGTNTASILSTYDTATYPTIDAGDDLTENTTGVARLPLYRFTATSGVISEVNKVVESIKYVNETFIKNVKVNNAAQADNADNSITQAQSDNSTKIATTAYVRTAIENVKNIVSGNIGISASYTSIAANQVKRQVNFVIGELNFDDSNATRYDTTNKKIGQIPEGFRPKATQNVIITINDWTFSGSPRPHKGTIEPDGSIYCSSKMTDGSGGSAVRAYKYQFKFGYEIT